MASLRSHLPCALKQGLSIRQKLALSSSWDPPVSVSNYGVIDVHHHVWVCVWVLGIQNQVLLLVEQALSPRESLPLLLSEETCRCHRVEFHFVETGDI